MESKQAGSAKIMGRLLLHRKGERAPVHATMVCITQHGQMGATGMSDYIEIIQPQSMTAKLYYQGEVISEYKIEQCDKCSKLTKFDKFGYQKGYDKTDNIIWCCGDCR
jgi:hypothetical protein